MTQGRHAAPATAYNSEEAARRLHADMLAEARADIDGLAQAWPTPTEEPYEIKPETGTLLAIIRRAQLPATGESSPNCTRAS